MNKDDILAEIQLLHESRTMRADDLTVNKVRQRLKCGAEQAEAYLMEIVDDGRLERVDGILHNGKEISVWRILSEKNGKRK